MDGGDFQFGDFPDDYALPDDAGAGPLRGWLPPEDRMWRHPSELGATSTGNGDMRSGRRTSLLTVAAVGVVGMAAVAGSAVMLSGAATNGPQGADKSLAISETSLVTSPSNARRSASRAGSVASGPDILSIGSSMRNSLVEVVVTDGSKVSRATGVVLPGGTLVATAAAILSSGERFSVVTADGKSFAAALAGADDKAGIGVIRLDNALASAPFADETVAPRQIAVTACMCDGSATKGADVAVGMVNAVGTTATTDGGPSLIDAIEAETPLGPSYGSVLLDDNGEVIGILDGVRVVGSDTLGYYVPTALALGVADQLAQGHQVDRGWLGVLCTDEPGGGAMVTTIVPDSPAQTAGMQAGDVVEAVDSHPVSSLADLQARLYTAPPGTHLELTVLHGSSTESVPVVVGAEPS